MSNSQTRRQFLESSLTVGGFAVIPSSGDFTGLTGISSAITSNLESADSRGQIFRMDDSIPGNAENHGASKVSNPSRKGSYAFHFERDGRSYVNSMLTSADLQSNGDKSFTFAMWVSFEEISNQTILFGNDDDNNKGRLLWAVEPTEQQFRIRAHSGYSNQWENVTLDAPSGIFEGWNHLALSYNSGTGRMAVYVNGSFHDEEMTSAEMNQPDEPIVIGAYDDWQGNITKGVEGYLDDVRVYNIPLTESDLEGIYDGSSPQTDTKTEQDTATATEASQETSTTSSSQRTDTETAQDTVTTETGDSSSESSGTKTQSGGQSSTENRRRGFFSNSAKGPSFLQNMFNLTMMGFVLSVVGIIHNMIGGK